MRRDPAVSGTIRLRVVAATPVVFVSGPPASGKTYVADLLAAHLSLPLIAKDRIKETLFDALGTGDTAWSRSLGRATFALLYAALERQLEAGRPVIVEANFDAIHAPAKLAELRRRYDFRPFEVHCTASLEVLRHRCAARAGSRHPGHADVERLADLEEALSEEHHPPLGLGGGPVMILDTTDFATLDVESVLLASAAHVGAPQSPL
jgi:glucokinase